MLSVSRTDVTRVFLTLIIIISPLTISQNISAATLKEQRQQYLDAKKALKSGKIKTFITLSEQLKTYPLYAYLRYNYLRPRLHKIDDADIKEFIHSYPDFISIDSLKTWWNRSKYDGE